MNKIKNFIYDKNDLLIALAIVVLAGFVISDRIGAIMDYPSMLTAQAAEQPAVVLPEDPGDASGGSGTDDPSGEGEGSEGTDTEGEVSGEGEGSEGTGTTGEGSEGTGTEGAGTEGGSGGVAGQTAGEPTVQQVSIFIEYGSAGSQIAQLLVDAGLISEPAVFYQAVEAAGADTKLQAGSFKIPSNATPEEIVRIITR